MRNIDDDSEWRAKLLKHNRQNLIGHGREAVETMRRFLDDAAREIQRAEVEQEDSVLWDLPAKILHALAWGQANASGEIGLAMKYARELQGLLAKGGK